MADDQNPTGKTIKFSLADLNASPLLQNHPEVRLIAIFSTDSWQILLTSKQLQEMEVWEKEEAERIAKLEEPDDDVDVYTSTYDMLLMEIDGNEGR